MQEGTAIVFADHYGANTPAFSTTIVGGPTSSKKNIFNTDLRKIILGYVYPAGLDENTISSADIYPNPATENLNIVLKDGIENV